MGYIIDRLRYREQVVWVNAKDIIWNQIENPRIEFERKSSTIEMCMIDGIAKPNSVYKPVDSNSGSVEKTPVPMYEETDGSRQVDKEKLAYYLAKKYGEGVYKIRFANGRGFKTVIRDFYVNQKEEHN